MATIYTIEGNTSGGNTLVANGGGVAAKSYSSTYSRIAKIWRPKYKAGEAKKVIDEAMKWKGYLEKKSNANLESFTANAGSNNYNIFADHAKKATGSGIYANGVAWCDIFVDDIAIRALGVTRMKELMGGYSAYTPTSSNYLQNAGATLITDFSKAQYGDIIFFKSSSGGICHVGYVTTGWNSNVKPEVPAPIDNNKTIFIKGVQSTCGATVDGVAGTETLSKTITISIKTNSKHPVVKVVQTYLNSLGYKCGTADGIFGNNTTSAVKLYQKDHGCVVDGIITAKNLTWKKLLGMA